MAFPGRGGAEQVFIAGAAGRIETLIDTPDSGAAPRGIALAAHPHPLYGGTLDNKVAQTHHAPCRTASPAPELPRRSKACMKGDGETANMLPC
jgi:hypothetical protein